jgi:hypothetical protein
MTSNRARPGRLIPPALLLASLFSWSGCGSSPDPTAAPPIKEEDKGKIVALLPPGVTLDSPIESNAMLGPNSKTVGEALTAIHAYVKEDKIYDGGMGRLIQFKTGKADSKAKPAKSAKTKESTTTIVVTGS